MNKILKYLTLIPGIAMLLFSIYIMGIAQDVNAVDAASTVVKVVIYIVSIIFVFLSISTILYSLSVINNDEVEKEELKKQASKTYQTIYKIAEFFGYSFWTIFIITITILGWKSIKGDILIIMSIFWLSALYTLYKLIRFIIKKGSN